MFEDASDVELIDQISAAARAESVAIAARLAAIGALDSLREQELIDSILWRTDPFEEVCAEVSAAMRIARGRAGTQVHHARVLRDKLPQVAARFAVGDIDYRVVRMLIARTTTADRSVWAELDAELAARASRWMRFSERQLRDRIDHWVAKLDPNGERVPPNLAEDRFVQVEPGSPGTATIWANVDAADAAALDQRLNALADTVCEHDPRSRERRRADAVGPLARLQAQLACRCGRDDCPAAQNRAAADAAVYHVLANQSTLEGTSDDPGYLPGYGILPAQRVRDLAATAKIKPLHVPVPAEPKEPTESGEAADTDEVSDEPGGATEPAEPVDTSERSESTGPGETSETSGPGDPAEPGYRPSVALSEFIRWRDLTCRFPGCDAPVDRCDIDHTAPWPAGPTHPSNTKLYCRTHHLVKTFCPGWSDRQLPDGTVEVTTPTGHTYTTEPHGAGMFPTLGQPTGDLNVPEPEAPSPNRATKMPKRSQTREQDRQDRINEERQLRAEFNNDLATERDYQAWLAEEYGPPPPF
ncbi:HNH endonuclease signature motif containing protein [Mycobacterium sp. DBP42]|uniref:HNH endonuclease signature motif containing protein n=1 Tax=Mycobacterium sp. DBP42 TaxID=2545267 RepID=UPI00110C917B|nr:HNH endonuclease signature motif containing protein [Mycobacterium sp. DBP42]TMS52609.1 HNH endonuclease [Mycobacterium sp. DBP42]